MAPETELSARGWGSPRLRRATFTLAFTQLVSWGVLFYSFAVVAPDMSADTGWSEPVVAGAFSVGLLTAGFAAPPVAAALTQRDPRLVLSAGSVIGIGGMLLLAAAHHVVVLYVAWVVIGIAMAATLYEPALAVVVALDPARRHRTIATITVVGGLASTLFAPLSGALVDRMGWRAALIALAICGGLCTTLCHALVLPSACALAAPPAPAPTDIMRSRGMRQLRTALVFEQAALLATTVHLVGLLVHTGLSLAAASAALGTIGVGKVAGRLLLLGPAGRWSFEGLAVVCNIVQVAGLAVPLVTNWSPAVFVSAAVVGAVAGASTVLRSLLILDLVGAAPFAAVSARLQRVTTVARSAAPFALGAGITALGWRLSWIIALSAFLVAAERYGRLGIDRRRASPVTTRHRFEPVRRVRLFVRDAPGPPVQRWSRRRRRQPHDGALAPPAP